MPLRGGMRCVMVGGIQGSEEISLRHCADVRREEQGGRVRFMTGVKIKWRNFSSEGDGVPNCMRALAFRTQRYEIVDLDSSRMGPG